MLTSKSVQGYFVLTPSLDTVQLLFNQKVWLEFSLSVISVVSGYLVLTASSGSLTIVRKITASPSPMRAYIRSFDQCLDVLSGSGCRGNHKS